MAQISKITLPSGTVYDIKDAQARSDIAGLQIAASGGMHYLGATTTPLTDGATNSTISIGGQVVTPIAGDIVIYDDKEFILSGTSPAHWNEFGSTGSLKALAFKDNASSTYKPAGTVSQPSFTGAVSSVYLTSTSSYDPLDAATSSILQGKVDYTPKGIISLGYTPTSFHGNFTPVGTITLTTANKSAAVTTASGTITYTPEGTISTQSFTGTAATLSVVGTPSGSITISTGTGSSNYKPAGTVSQPSFTGTSATLSVSGTPSGSVTISTASGTANYTPAGSVSAPNLTVEVNTATVNSITAVGTLPDLTMTVANENLTIGWDEGTLPTKGSNQTVATGIKTATASQPSFTGTGARLTASFTGSATTSTGSYTPAGSVSQPTFTGTATQLKGTFSGSATTSTGSYTPAGTISQSTFTGTGKRLVTGNIAVPTSATFNGTQGVVQVASESIYTDPQFIGWPALFEAETTAAGSVSKPTFAGTQATITVS